MFTRLKRSKYTDENGNRYLALRYRSEGCDEYEKYAKNLSSVDEDTQVNCTEFSMDIPLVLIDETIKMLKSIRDE